MASRCMWRRLARALWWCSYTAFRSCGIPTGISWRRWPRPGSRRLPDQRGYGRTAAPDDVGKYTLVHLGGDVVALVTACSEKRIASWSGTIGGAALPLSRSFRPDVVRGVSCSSVPYLPLGDTDTLSVLTQLLGPNNYQVFFQEPRSRAGAGGRRPEVGGVDIHRSVGEAPEVNLLNDVDQDAPFGTFAESALPAWLTKEDVDQYTREYERTGYRGGLNWYRNSQSNWELMAAWDGAPLVQSSLFVAGDRDPVIHWFVRFGERELRCPAKRVDAEPDQGRDAGGMRSLDAAGAPGRGQPGASAVPRGPSRPLSHRSAGSAGMSADAPVVH